MWYMSGIPAHWHSTCVSGEQTCETGMETATNQACPKNTCGTLIGFLYPQPGESVPVSQGQDVHICRPVQVYFEYYNLIHNGIDMEKKNWWGKPAVLCMWCMYTTTPQPHSHPAIY